MDSEGKKPQGEHGTVCPKCGAAGSLRRRHTQGFLPVFARTLTPYRRYICIQCGKTTWRHSHSKPRLFSEVREALTPTFWIVVALIVAAVLLGRLIAR